MGRKLHIGGKQKKEGWEILNIMDGEHVDHLGDAADLAMFEPETFDEVYASHILEHFSYKEELQDVLKQWHRVLKTGGKLHISVPDLDVLCSLVLNKELAFRDRFYAMRMMFGGQINEFDYHQTGFNEEILEFYLSKAGFRSIERVARFGIFNDCSSKVHANQAISLNVSATK